MLINFDLKHPEEKESSDSALKSGSFVMEPETEAGNSSFDWTSGSNAVVVNGISVGDFLLRNTSQVSKVFKSHRKQPLVLVQNVFNRPNAQGITLTIIWINFDLKHRNFDKFRPI